MASLASRNTWRYNGLKALTAAAGTNWNWIAGPSQARQRS